MKIRNLILGIVGLVVIVIGFVWWITTPRYEIIQEKRSIAFSESKIDEYAISPAKVKVTNLWKFRPLRIKISVSNINEETIYQVREGEPQKYDSGYIKCNDSDYSFKVYPTDFAQRDSDTVEILIARQTWSAIPMQEKGFAITEMPQVSSGIGVGRSYIFEILIDK